MSSQWPALGPQSTNPVPGVYINNAQAWSNVGFYPATSIAGENAPNDVNYYPYDRIIHVPRIGRDFSNGWGAWLYQRDRILQNGSAGWTDVHMCTGQQTFNDFQNHSGLYSVFGTDGKLYVCGFYPGNGANEVGTVRLDVETGAWSSTLHNTVNIRFSATTYPIQHRGQLVWAARGVMWRYDPVNDDLDEITLPDGHLDFRDKLFSLGKRLFLAARHSTGAMRVYEYYGGWYQHASLRNWNPNNGADFGVMIDFGEASLIYFDGPRALPGGTTFFTHYTISVSGPGFLSPLVITDVTDATSPLSFGLVPNANSTVYCAQDADDNPTVSTGNTIFVGLGNANPYQSTREPFRYAGSNARWTDLMGSIPGSISYTSARYGLGDTLLNNTNKNVCFRVSRADNVKAGALRFDYWAFSTAPGTDQAVRIYFRDRSVAGAFGRLGTKLPLQAGTIIDFDAGGGTLNAAERRVEGVPTLLAGAAHYLVWDVVADLGEDSDPSDLYANLLMNNPLLLPPL